MIYDEIVDFLRISRQKKRLVGYTFSYNGFPYTASFALWNNSFVTMRSDRFNALSSGGDLSLYDSGPYDSDVERLFFYIISPYVDLPLSQCYYDVFLNAYNILSRDGRVRDLLLKSLSDNILLV